MTRLPRLSLSSFTIIFLFLKGDHFDIFFLSSLFSKEIYDESFSSVFYDTAREMSLVPE